VSQRRTSSSQSASETELVDELRLELSRGDTRIFRNNVGFGFSPNGYPIHFGLCKGSSDLIGVRRYEIEPDDVGKTIGVFVSLEAKSRRGTAAEAQRAWGAMVESLGGVHGIVRSLADARRVLTGWRPGRGNRCPD
jgi:hypothetical protein